MEGFEKKVFFPVGNFSGGKAWSLFEFWQGFLNLRLFTGNICAAILNFGERGKRNAQFFSSWKVCYVRMHPYAQCYNLFSPPSLATFLLLVKTTWETKNKATSAMEVTREHSQNITLKKLSRVSSFPTQQLMHDGGMTFCKASQHSPSLSGIKFAFPPRTFQKSLVSPPSETSLAL